MKFKIRLRARLGSGQFHSHVLPLFTLLLISSGWAVQAIAQDSQQSLLPLVQGNAWALEHPWAAAQYRLTVSSLQRAGGNVRAKLQIDNPWHPYGLVLRPEGDKIWLEGVEAADFNFRLDQPEELFVLHRPLGSQWTTALGVITYESANRTVHTPVGTFSQVHKFRVGNQAWYLKQGVGVVQIGDGDGAFLLREWSEQAPHGPESAAHTHGPCPKLGLDLSPAPGFPEQELGRLHWMAAAGVRFANLGLRWSDLEPAPYQYQLTALDDWALWASRYNLDLSLTLRVIDTHILAIPADLAGRGLDDPVVLDRFALLLNQVERRMGNRVLYLNLSNEVDLFLRSNSARENELEVFFDRAKQQLRSLRPALSLGLVFTHGLPVSSESLVKRWAPLLDHVAYTYYPLQTNFKIRPLQTVGLDLAAAIDWTTKPVIFTEVGVPSFFDSAGHQAQRAVVAEFLNEAKRYSGRLKGLQFFQLGDMPPLVLESLAPDYLQPGMDRQKFFGFLGSLGMVDSAGIPKPSIFELLNQLGDYQKASTCYVFQVK